MKRCLRVKSVMDSSKHPIQNVHIVEPSLKMKKRKKSLNKLAKDLLGHLDPDHLDLRVQDLLGQRKVDHQGRSVALRSDEAVK